MDEGAHPTAVRAVRETLEEKMGLVCPESEAVKAELQQVSHL